MTNLTNLTVEQTNRFFRIMNVLNELLEKTNTTDCLKSVQVVGASLEIKLDDVFSTPELCDAFNVNDIEEFVRTERDSKTVWLTL